MHCQLYLQIACSYENKTCMILVSNVICFKMNNNAVCYVLIKMFMDFTARLYVLVSNKSEAANTAAGLSANFENLAVDLDLILN